MYPTATLLLVQGMRKFLKFCFWGKQFARSASELRLSISRRLINLKGGTVERYVQGNHAVESSRQEGLNKLTLSDWSCYKVFILCNTEQIQLALISHWLQHSNLHVLRENFACSNQFWFNNIPLKQSWRITWRWILNAWWKWQNGSQHQKKWQTWTKLWSCD